MQTAVSHNRQEETLLEKARWFQQLTCTERLDMLNYFYELALSQHPDMAEHKHAEPVPGRIQVLTRPPG